MADVIAYNGSDKWKQKATELLNQGGGGGGLVDDVKVNDGTLTMKNGDQTKGTFSANQSSNANVVILPFDITGNTTIGFTPVYPS